jgi:DNA-binding transcriptional LysR family regulator
MIKRRGPDRPAADDDHPRRSGQIPPCPAPLISARHYPPPRAAFNSASRAIDRQNRSGAFFFQISSGGPGVRMPPGPATKDLMQIDLLDTFLDLAETRSFHRTAERLRITQSTVSARVTALEQAVGVAPFRPVPRGHRPHARGASGSSPMPARCATNGTRRGARIQIAAGAAQLLRLGIQNDLAAVYLGDWVAEFRRALPETAFYIEPDYSNQMCATWLTGIAGLRGDVLARSPTPTCISQTCARDHVRIRIMPASGGAGAAPSRPPSSRPARGRIPGRAGRCAACSQPTIGRSQSGMRRSGRPPAARSVLARKPFTAPCACPRCRAAGSRTSSPSSASSSSPRSLRTISHCSPVAAHVAHGDVGQHVGVVHAGAAGQREEVGRQLRDRQLQEGDLALGRPSSKRSSTW